MALLVSDTFLDIYFRILTFSSFLYSSIANALNDNFIF